MAGKDQPKNQAIGRTGLITFLAGISVLLNAGGGMRSCGCLPSTLILKMKLKKKLKES
jgi:hypothetical protein